MPFSAIVVGFALMERSKYGRASAGRPPAVSAPAMYNSASEFAGSSAIAFVNSGNASSFRPARIRSTPSFVVASTSLESSERMRPYCVSAAAEVAAAQPQVAEPADGFDLIGDQRQHALVQRGGLIELLLLNADFTQRQQAAARKTDSRARSVRAR